MVTIKNGLFAILIALVVNGCSISGNEELEIRNNDLNVLSSEKNEEEDDEEEETVFVAYNGTTVEFNLSKCEKKKKNNCETAKYVATYLADNGGSAITPRRPKECPIVGYEKPLLSNLSGKKGGSTCIPDICGSLFGSECLSELRPFKISVHSVRPNLLIAQIIVNGEVLEELDGQNENAVVFNEAESLAIFNFKTPLVELSGEEVIVEIITVVEIEDELVETNLSVNL